jgi:hypothetical protein
MNTDLVTYDFEALYTSIRKDNVLQTFFMFKLLLDLDVTKYNYMTDLCKFVLENRVFQMLF